MVFDIFIADNYSGFKINGLEACNDGDLSILVLTDKILNDESTKNSSNVKLCDIGADKGTWTLAAHVFCPTAEILCFEPNPTAFQNSKDYFQDYSMIKWFNCAISDSSGILQLTLNGDQTHSRENSENCFSIPKFSIQSFLQTSDFLTLVKIDTEGHELIILKDMLSLVQQKKIGSIITEFTVYWYGHSKEECLQNSTEILDIYSQYFPYIYFLSRNGIPSLLYIPKNYFYNFCLELYNLNLQTDLCFTNISFKKLKVRIYTPNSLKTVVLN